jgi:hypothetical protein
MCLLTTFADALMFSAGLRHPRTRTRPAGGMWMGTLFMTRSIRSIRGVAERRRFCQAHQDLIAAHGAKLVLAAVAGGLDGAERQGCVALEAAIMHVRTHRNIWLALAGREHDLAADRSARHHVLEFASAVCRAAQKRSALLSEG